MDASVDEISHSTLTRWSIATLASIISILLVVIFSLVAWIWASQGEQVRDLRGTFQAAQLQNAAEVKVLQNQVADMRVAMQRLDSRIQSLVDTLNERALSPAKRP